MFENIDRSKLSPMMRNYLETREAYPDCILFYRLGDFYEMFFDDAQTVSKELELTLTGKSCGLEERAPMCGVPFHAAETYLNRLVSRGYKVAICEQVEDPKTAKGLVKREVIRVVTPGTNTDPGALDETKNNYILCVVQMGDVFGISIADVTTGDFFVTEAESLQALADEIMKFMPSEIVCNETILMSGLHVEDYRERMGIHFTSLDSRYFQDDSTREQLCRHFKVQTLEGLGITDFGCGVMAAGALLTYLYETQKTDLSHMTRLVPYASQKYMLLDSSTRRNLELTETLREKKKRGSLLWVLDHTKTAMGARLLRSYIEQPLIEKEEIERRLDSVEELYANMIAREELREYLNPVYDLERLIGRIVCTNANPRDLIAFKTSLRMLEPIRQVLAEFSSDLIVGLREQIDPLTDLCELIEASINDDPPIQVREAGILKDGYNADVDRLRSARTQGKTWLAELEETERQKTGIKNLRIRYNRVFGYYLEVLNTYKDLVPEHYVRKQTLTNAERYSTPELKELEDTILGAEDKLGSLEYNLFCEIRKKIAHEVVRIQTTAKAIAALDVLVSFAYVSERNGYVRPKINEKGRIRITEGRHPVVEKMLRHELFVPNDMELDQKSNRIAIITGPNMAGKSTYMRQNALIVLMAQCGCFVPAKKADIGLVDRIFTRVGASDDLASGQSTFMVEMTEVANILRNATPRSLLILDEIGRGTSTNDGLSIAWAVVEYISNPKTLGAKTLFATHYHELTQLEGKLSNVRNYCIAVNEQGDDIVFLRRIIPGGADRSYGIQVAKLAGVPQDVIERAKEISDTLETADLSEITETMAAGRSGKKNTVKPVDELTMAQYSFAKVFDDQSILDELKNLSITTMTPLDALNKLNELHNKACNRW